MEQETKTKSDETELNLESIDITNESTPLDMEVARYNDPRFEEEGRQRLHDLALKIESLAEESRITLTSIFQETTREKGMMNKLALVLRRLKDKMTTSGSSTHNSLSFITATIRALDSYNQEIPMRISKFQSGITTLKMKKAEVTSTVKAIRAKLKQVTSELEKARKAMENEADVEKKEILRSKEQEIVNIQQNMEVRGNKSLKELENLNNTTDLFLEMKKAYEILLKQVSNLSEDLKKHKKILETVGPSVAEVRKVVLTLDKFTNLIGEYRRRDNEEVRLTTKAIIEITPAIQNMERSWYNKKTVEQVKENVKKAGKAYKEHFGHDINKLEEYGPDGKIKKSKDKIGGEEVEKEDY